MATPTSTSTAISSTRYAAYPPEASGSLGAFPGLVLRTRPICLLRSSLRRAWGRDNPLCRQLSA